MDLQMPEMDGLTATIEIRKQDKFKDLPIIAMTAHAMQEELQKCLDVGMNDYFTKPIDPNALFNLIAKWVANSPRLNAAQEIKHEKIKSKIAVNKRHDNNKIKIEVSPEDEFLAQVRSLNCLDVDGAIKSMGGRTHIYLQLITDFNKNYKETVDSLREIYQAKKYDDAFRIAHSLKSNANYIGAIRLTKKAKELEFQLKEKPASASLLIAETSIELNNVIMALATLEQNSHGAVTADDAITNDQSIESTAIENIVSGEQSNDIPTAQLNLLLNSIENLIEQENAEAEDLLPRLIAITINTKLEALAQDICDDVDDIEYADALNKIKTLRGKLV